MDDIVTGVEKAVTSLPVEMAEDAEQETVRIVKDFSRPREYLTVAKKKALRSLRTYTDLTMLPVDKSNASATQRCGLKSEDWYPPTRPSSQNVGQGPHRDI
jgi:hypothetical protein